MLGNGGDSPPGGSGGMIPSVAPPFGMTRWVAQTRVNYVSVTPYNYTQRAIYGFQATHQPAIWMGESGTFTVSPGVGDVKPTFEDRGLAFEKEDEQVGPAYYKVVMDDGRGGTVTTEMTASEILFLLQWIILLILQQRPVLVIYVSPSIVPQIPISS